LIRISAGVLAGTLAVYGTAPIDIVKCKL